MQVGVVCPAVPTARLRKQGSASCQHVLASSKAAYVRQPLRLGAARCPRTPSRSSGLVVHAAAASAGGDDPYLVKRADALCPLDVMRYDECKATFEV